MVSNLNEDLAFKLLEKTFATNKKKKCPITTLLQQINLVNIHGIYAANNSDNIWTSNRVQRRLDYVFTDVVTVSLDTNIRQVVTTAMVTLNSFVVPNKILDKIFTAAASPLPNINGNNNGSTPNIKQDQPLAVLPDEMKIESSTSSSVSGVADDNAWMNVNGQQKFSGWVASILVPGAIFKIKMALLSFLFQLLPGCIGFKSVLQNAVKLFCVEFAFQESLIGVTKVAIGNEVFLTTLKIARFSGVVSVSSSSLSIALHDILLSTSSNNIKTVLGIFGVVMSIKLKPTGL
ncbi:hypothetical protein G9A89_022545 [Geosiphon pyriformis]|nr:hypothetical protein G9A89_022545 [Geosiphon pyriformis]